MKKLLLVLILVIIMVGVVSTGVLAMDKLINIPTADLAGGQGAIHGEMTLNSVRQIEGVYNLTPQLEVGGIMRFIDSDQAKLGALAKVILSRENEKEPAISAGIRMSDIYFVISKNMGMGFRGHLGIGNGELRGLFFGFNKVVNPVNISKDGQPSLPVINLMGEYIDQNLNVGARINLQQNIKFDISVVNLDSLKLGLGYTF